jgi:hypothetical protein
MAHFKKLAASHTRNAGLYSRQSTAFSNVGHMSQPRYLAALSRGMWAVSMPWTVYCHLTMRPMPRNQQRLTNKMLGPFKTIDSIFKSRTYDPAEVFGSLLKRNVGRFNAMDSILSSNNEAHAKESAATHKQNAGPIQNH